MSEGKRYYWLKLKEDFFSSKRIKKLRKMAGGDTYTIIYLKLQLLAMKKDGILEWSGLEDSVADELALDIDEAPEDVRVTLIYLLSCGLAETSDNISFFFPYAVENVGSETSAAKRMRDMRERNNVTPLLRDSYGEIEKEIEIEIDKKSIEKKRFVPPTLEDVRAYCKERNSSVDPLKFFEYYTAGNWKDSKGNPVRNWKQKLITWERRDENGRADVKSSSAKVSGGNKKKPTGGFKYDV